nr:uncharacterized protein LOC129380649 isoform X5 [Dermacentor andersoni]
MWTYPEDCANKRETHSWLLPQMHHMTLSGYPTKAVSGYLLCLSKSFPTILMVVAGINYYLVFTVKDYKGHLEKRTTAIFVPSVDTLRKRKVVTKFSCK